MKRGADPALTAVFFGGPAPCPPAPAPASAFSKFSIIPPIPQNIGTENHVHFLPRGKRLPRQATKETRQRGRPAVASLDSPPLGVRPPPADGAPWRGLAAGGFSRGRSLSDGCPQVRRSAALAGDVFALPLVGHRAIFGLAWRVGTVMCCLASSRPEGSPSLGAPSLQVRRGGRLGVGRESPHVRKSLS